MFSIISRGSGEIYQWFFRSFSSTCKKLQKYNHGNNYGTRKFDAKHSAFDNCTYLKGIISLIKVIDIQNCTLVEMPNQKIKS